MKETRYPDSRASGADWLGEVPPKDQLAPRPSALVSQALNHMPQASRHMSQAPDHMSQAGTELFDRLPEDLRREVRDFVQRSGPERDRALILRLCRLRAWRAEELAQLLGRDAAYLVRRHVTPLVEAGQLGHTIPEMPRHPEQAYRTVGTDEAAP